MPNSYFYSLLPEGISREFADSLVNQYESPDQQVAQRGVGDPDRFYPYEEDGSFYVGYGTYLGPSSSMTEQQAIQVQNIMDNGISTNDALQRLATGLSDAQSRIQAQATRGGRSVPDDLLQELVAVQYQDPRSDLTDDVWNSIQSQDYLKTTELLADKAPQTAELVRSTVPAKSDSLGVVQQIANRTAASEVVNFTSLTDGASQVVPDSGGTTSYGWFGLNTGLNTDRGSIDEFIDANPQLGLTAEPGSVEFEAQWKALDPNVSNQAQLAFFEETRVNPARERLEALGVPPELANDAGVINTVADSLVQLGGLTDGHLRETVNTLTNRGTEITRESFLNTLEDVQIRNIPNNFVTALAENPDLYAGLLTRAQTRAQNGLDFLATAAPTETANNSRSIRDLGLTPDEATQLGIDPNARVGEVLASGTDPSISTRIGQFLNETPGDIRRGAEIAAGNVGEFIGGIPRGAARTAQDIADFTEPARTAIADAARDFEESQVFDPNSTDPTGIAARNETALDNLLNPEAPELSRARVDFNTALNGGVPLTPADIADLDAGVADGSLAPTGALTVGIETGAPIVDDFGRNDDLPVDDRLPGELLPADPTIPTIAGNPRGPQDQAPRITDALTDGIITAAEANDQAEAIVLRRNIIDEAEQGQNVRDLVDLATQQADFQQAQARATALRQEQERLASTQLAVERAREDQFLSGAQLARQALNNVDTSGAFEFLAANEGPTRVSSAGDTFSLGATDGVDLLSPAEFRAGIVAPDRLVADANLNAEQALARQVRDAESRAINDQLLSNEILRNADIERRRRIAIGDVNAAGITTGDRQVGAQTGLDLATINELARFESEQLKENDLRDRLASGAIEVGDNQAEVDVRTAANQSAQLNNRFIEEYNRLSRQDPTADVTTLFNRIITGNFDTRRDEEFRN